MPSVNALAKIVETIQEIIFPGYFGRDVVCANTIEFYTGVNVDKLFAMLTQQIHRGLMFDSKDLTKEGKVSCQRTNTVISGCENLAND